MISFEVKDMTCAHCVASITQAVMAVDPAARVDIDLGRHLVTIEPAEASQQVLSAAIEAAGYTPVAPPATAAESAEARTRGGACGCGCG
jgi:copper chaperone